MLRGKSFKKSHQLSVYNNNRASIFSFYYASIIRQEPYIYGSEVDDGKG